MSALPLGTSPARSTSIDFAKNQLSLSLIGLSPLPTTHPRLLPQTSVRSSTRRYARFNLVIGRSLSFGSNEGNPCTLHTRVCSASTSPLKLAAFIYSLTHYTKGTPPGLATGVVCPETACPFQSSGSLSLPCPGFFSLFPHGTCALSVSTPYVDGEGGPPQLRPRAAAGYWSPAPEPPRTGLSPSLVTASTVFGGGGLGAGVWSGVFRQYCRNLG